MAQLVKAGLVPPWPGLVLLVALAGAVLDEKLD